jgi:hypothetical protein
MLALPALVLATDAVRDQFAPTPSREPARKSSRSTSRIRVALAAILERAARAVAPAGPAPAQ